jgi:hypothetical protein
VIWGLFGNLRSRSLSCWPNGAWFNGSCQNWPREILARTVNQKGKQKVLLSTAARVRTHSRRHPSPRATGSRGNDGGLRFLALATCYGKDLHREANQRGMQQNRSKCG